MAKYYAVINGHTIQEGILTSWDACKKEVTGAKGVIFKSFPTQEEAREFLRLHGKEVPLKQADRIKEKNQEKPAEVSLESSPISEATIYVDGSYELSTGRYAYGMVVVEQGEEVASFKEARQGEYSAMRNVAGEVLGAMKAMSYAKEHGYQKLILYFDYQGIESWALGTWKRNNTLTQGYHEFYQNMKKDITVKFMKVKGHSGDRFNDRADELAKSAFHS
ncbi:viroplasmin family protein [Proteiniclasticum ruminis]|uniref:ribonuclease H n=1 Tax=Proteiniclasticum ruminis TaxID=398199 RepID=A0A1I4ZRZ6_9CLOT|nr:ribonuclease H family protein [Proteiniclasticum ruminis]SFN52760.1 ribonuclease HI [Proteiniclasticum ruminis]